MFKVKKVDENAVIPRRATPGSAGLDISSVEEKIVLPGESVLVSTGLSISIPEDCYARIAPRSGLAAKNGIFVNAGVIDSDYRGVIKVILYNSKKEEFKVNVGDRIAQIIFEKIYVTELVEVEELNDTERGSGGFGSTSNK